MLTSDIPTDWRDLEATVAMILTDCGFVVETSKQLGTVRGSVEIDVHAIENRFGRLFMVLCECKHWKSNIPQTVVHAFRTVVQDSGANVGYIITSSDFQTGSVAAAGMSNVKLLTYPEFLNEFTGEWFVALYEPIVKDYLDRITTMIHEASKVRKTIIPTPRDEQRKKFHDKWTGFMLLLIALDPTHNEDEGMQVRALPLRGSIKENYFPYLPDAIFIQTGYREMLMILGECMREAIAEFEAIGSESS